MTKEGFHVSFNFILDQMVITPLDEEPGIITMLGFDESGKTYYVRTKFNDGWFKEESLEAMF